LQVLQNPPQVNFQKTTQLSLSQYYFVKAYFLKIITLTFRQNTLYFTDIELKKKISFIYQIWQ
jgi:hypothetical protein